jgi:hypothetical protein
VLYGNTLKKIARRLETQRPTRLVTEWGIFVFKQLKRDPTSGI